MPQNLNAIKSLIVV